MLFKKYWKSILGVAFWLGPIWDFIKWCLDWRGRVDALAATYHDIGGYHLMIAYLLNPPSWLYPPFMIAGLALIWWNLQRPKKANLEASAQNGDLPPGTVVSLDGSCDFKIGGKNFECEGKLAYTHFTNGRTQINVLPKVLGAVAFSGGKDLQLKPEYYFLTVDRLILSGGTIVPADGFCSIHLQADGQIVYMVEGNALAHDGRVFEFKFTPDPKPPVIFNI
jgi:hypothetical protein